MRQSRNSFRVMFLLFYNLQLQKYFSQFKQISYLTFLSSSYIISSEHRWSVHQNQIIMDTDAQLIELVEHFSFIYNKKHIDFKNKLARENAWKTISEILNDTAENVSARWVILRNRYASEKRKEKTTPSGSGAYNTWPHFKKMQFLDQFYSPRRTLGNVSISSSPCISSEISEESQQSPIWSEEVIIEVDEFTELEDTPGNSDHAGIPIASTDEIVQSKAAIDTRKIIQENKENMRTFKGKKKSSNRNIEDSVSKAFDKIGAYLESSEDIEDEDYLFGKSIGKSIQSIKNKKQKSRAKIEILEILDKYVED